MTYNSQRWDEWMRRALNGDRDAYRLLLTDLRPWLTAYFRKRVHRSAVEDLVQDSLMSLHAKRHTFSPDYPFGPWIAAVARHRWIDHMRKTAKYTEVELDHDFPAARHEYDECAGRDVRALLKHIPTAQAEMIEMVKLQEMSIAAVSKKTGRSASSVKIMVHRGMKKLMASVKQAEDE